jgi:hypothetical protein
VVNLSAIANPQVERYHWKRVKKSGSNSGHIVRNDLMSLSLDKFEEFEELTKSSIQAHGSLLYISNISRSDSGLYICSASNKIGESRAFLEINVFCKSRNKLVFFVTFLLTKQIFCSNFILKCRFGFYCQS